MARRPRPRLYNIWRAMKSRCYLPSHKSYSVYGGAGITVCPEWITSYASFREWAMSNGYEDHLTIDRYPNKAGNYEPTNCRWATWTEQERNRKDNLTPVTAFGETKIVCDWLADERCKVGRTALLTRLATGRDPEWAISTPARIVAPRRKPHSEETKLRMAEAARNRKVRVI